MRNKKKIVVFFGKNRNCSDPFADFGKKRSVYHQLFKKGTGRGFEMYIASGRESYLGNLDFQHPWIYNGSSFKKHAGKISADAVYDRSGGLKFPAAEISYKVLNGMDFKRLCYNKNLTYSLLPKFMPKNYAIKNEDELHEALKNFASTELVVLKPVAGFGGKDIFIDLPENISLIKINGHTEYALQQFIDTKGGISGMVSGRHDLRIIIVEGKIVLCHVRKPKEGSFLANVAQGGSIKEVALNLVPQNISRVVSEIQSIIDAKFNKPIYSIDLGLSSDGKPYVFELNDQIGFPSEEMKNSAIFVEKILDSLERLSRL